MTDRNYPSDEEKEIMLNLYKCHFTAREVTAQMRFSYQTIRTYFRGFEMAEIKKYDRMNLLEETYANVECNS